MAGFDLFGALGGAIGGAANWVGGGINQVATAVQSAILGNNVQQKPATPSGGRGGGGQTMTEEQYGALVEKEHKNDPLIQAKAVGATLLNLNIFPSSDFNTKYGQRQAYLRALAQEEAYEKNPASMLWSPLAVTAYTYPLFWGAGKVGMFAFSRGMQAAGKVGPVVVKGAGTALFPTGTTAAQAALTAGGGAMLGYGAYSSGKAIVEAYPERTVAQVIGGRQILARRGGLQESGKVAIQEGVKWYGGIQGSSGQALFSTRASMARRVLPQYEQERAYPAGTIKKETYPSLTGKNVRAQNAKLFAKGTPRSKGLPEFYYNERLVSHASINLPAGKKQEFETLFVTPGESPAPAYLRLFFNYRNMTAIPQKTSLSGRPRIFQIYTPSGKVLPVKGKGLINVPTPEGRPALFGKGDVVGTLREPVYSKAEIEAMMRGGMGVQEAPAKLTMGQKLFSKLFLGGTPYWTDVGGKAVASPMYIMTGKPNLMNSRLNSRLYRKNVYREKPVGKEATKAIIAAASRKSSSSGLDFPVPFTAPIGESSSRAVSMVFGSSSPSQERSSGGGSSGGGSSGKSSPMFSSSTSRSRGSLSRISTSKVSLPGGFPKMVEEKELRSPSKYQLDYYNELRRSFKEVFGAAI